MKKILNKINGLYIPISLILFILIGFTCLNKCRKPDGYKILLFEYKRPANYYMKDSFNDPSSRFEINRIKMNMGNQLTENRKNLYSRWIVFNYHTPGNFRNFYHYFPRSRVFHDKKRNRFFIGQHISKYDKQDPNILQTAMELQTMIFKKSLFNDTLIFDREFNIQKCYSPDHYIEEYVDISDDGKKLITNSGFIIDIKKGNFINTCGSDSSYGAFIHDNIVTIEEDEEYYTINRKIEKNNVVSSITEKRFGKDFRNTNWHCQTEYNQLVTGAKSPDGSRLAFINPGKNNVLLSLYYPKTNLLDNGIIVKNNTKMAVFNDGIYNTNSLIVWGNIPAKGMIAEYDEYSIIDANNGKKESENKETGMIVICDANKKSIVDKINIDFGVRSLRWSQDDKKLGILANIENKPRGPIYKGVLYIYDLDTRKLTKLMDCPDCFDFHFVE